MLKSADGKSKHYSFKEIPTDMQANRKPELLGADITISKKKTGKENSRRADPCGVWIAEMQAAEDDRRDKESPEQIQPASDGLKMITPKKEFFVEAD